LDNSQKYTGVTGYLSWMLRTEGLAVLLVALLSYHHLALASWRLFFVCFLFPDISFLGYLGGKNIGSAFYNLMHSYSLPLCLGIVFWYLSLSDFYFVIIIWIAHIGFDRALGYGLKYSAGFRYTHLGKIGKDKLRHQHVISN
jgi:hypothetical protein